MGSNYGTVKECSNNGKVGGKLGIGGIVGQNAGMIKDCYNSGILKSIYPVSEQVGGIVANNTGTIINCYNTSNIEDLISGCGGIVGRNDNKILNCYNSGNIVSTVTSGNAQCGGIAGHDYSLIYNCYNSGTVNGSQGLMAGGITGSTSNSTVSKVTCLSNCYNMGTTLGRGRVGSISGQVFTGDQVVNIQKCYGINSNYLGYIPSSSQSRVVTENLGTIDLNGNLSTSVTINGTAYNTLITALNAWVDANKTTYPELKNWQLVDGLPTFVE